jgi:hypothetical protein
MEGKDQNEDDYDKEEHLAWKKYLMVSSFFLIFKKMIEDIRFSLF